MSRDAHACVFALINFEPIDRLWLKFGMNIMPLDASPSLYLVLHYHR
jgi:hypothetical protein